MLYCQICLLQTVPPLLDRQRIQSSSIMIIFRKKVRVPFTDVEVHETLQGFYGQIWVTLGMPLLCQSLEDDDSLIKWENRLEGRQELYISMPCRFVTCCHMFTVETCAVLAKTSLFLMYKPLFPLVKYFLIVERFRIAKRFGIFKRFHITKWFCTILSTVGLCTLRLKRPWFLPYRFCTTKRKVFYAYCTSPIVQ